MTHPTAVSNGCHFFTEGARRNMRLVVGAGRGDSNNFYIYPAQNIKTKNATNFFKSFTIFLAKYSLVKN